MAQRLFESLGCWSYLEGKRPGVPVTLSTLDGREVLSNELMPVDTGFDGTMLISRETFTHFERAELPESESRVYRTLVGPISRRSVFE
jgi:hypothetical protein